MKLKTLILLCFTSFSVSASSLKEYSDVPFQLYLGCVKATVSSQRDIEPTRVGISDFVRQLDENCLAWTVIWYPALVGKDITSISDRELINFNNKRISVLGSLTRQIQAEALR